MTFKLPSAVYSPQLLESVIYDLKTYIDWYQQNNTRKKVGATPSEEPTHSAETALVIEAWLDGKKPTLESLQGLVEHLQKLHLPQAHITLAALPNHAQRQLLVDWFRSNISPDLLLSFVADRNVGGGVMVRTSSRIFDYTWSGQLTAGRAKLAEIVKHV